METPWLRWVEKAKPAGKMARFESKRSGAGAHWGPGEGYRGTCHVSVMLRVLKMWPLSLRHSCQSQTLCSGSLVSDFSGCSNPAACAEAFPSPHSRNPPGAGKIPQGLMVLWWGTRFCRVPSLRAHVGIAHPREKPPQPQM